MQYKDKHDALLLVHVVTLLCFSQLFCRLVSERARAHAHAGALPVALSNTSITHFFHFCFDHLPQC